MNNLKKKKNLLSKNSRYINSWFWNRTKAEQLQEGFYRQCNIKKIK